MKGTVDIKKIISSCVCGQYFSSNFGDKITVFACLLSDEGCDSFAKHLDLELAPDKTNKIVKK